MRIFTLSKIGQWKGGVGNSSKCLVEPGAQHISGNSNQEETTGVLSYLHWNNNES